MMMKKKNFACGIQSAKKYICIQQTMSLPEIMTQLPRIINRPCYEQLHVGTIFSLPNYTISLCRRKCLFMNVRLMLMAGRDVNISSVLLN